MIDLIQEGNVGLMHAVKEFNPYKGVRLITYAVWWIRGYIQEYLMKQHSLVKIGTTQNQKKLFYQLQKQQKDLNSLEKGEDIRELSERLGIPEAEVREMSARMSGRDVSLDIKVGDHQGSSLLDFQAEPDGALQPDEILAREQETSLLKEKLDELLPTLNEKEIFILQNRILSDEPLTLQDIGDHYGTSREAVRQMEARVMKKIKGMYEP